MVSSCDLEQNGGKCKWFCHLYMLLLSSFRKVCGENTYLSYLPREAVSSASCSRVRRALAKYNPSGVHDPKKALKGCYSRGMLCEVTLPRDVSPG
jgi:hypothetical protein